MMSTRTFLAALAALALSAPAAAQGCIGAAVPDGARALQLTAGTASYAVGSGVDGTDLGLAYRANPRGPLAYGVEYARRTLGEADAPANVGSAMVALRAPDLPLVPALLALCVRAGVEAARVSQEESLTEYTNVTVPLALVVELPLPVAPGATLVPYAAPQYLYSRTSGEVFAAPLEETGTGWGIEAGAGLRLGRFTVGAGYLSTDLPAALGTPALPRERVFVRAGVLF